MITRTTLCWLLLALLGQIPPHAEAQRGGRNRFPQFRNLSGLAGSGYGVGADGYSSLSGPTAFSTPVAHVIGRSQWRIGFGGTNSVSASRPLLGVNGTAVITYGHTIGRYNVALTDMVLSSGGDQAFHLQAQYIPSPEIPWVVSVGVQDAGGGGGSAGTDVPGDSDSSRSLFGVATLRLDTDAGPLYLSAGIGTRRFMHPFVSASYQVARPLRLWAERDGFAWNVGALWTYRQGSGPRVVEGNLLVGLMEGGNFAVAVGIGF